MKLGARSGKQSSITITGEEVRKMKTKKENSKMLRFLCLFFVIVFGLMAIIGSGGHFYDTTADRKTSCPMGCRAHGQRFF
jgi:hypothetical protein